MIMPAMVFTAPKGLTADDAINFLLLYNQYYCTEFYVVLSYDQNRSVVVREALLV